jgi:hypothetical protein
MILPFIIFTVTDPQVEHLDIRLHTMAFYLALSSYTVNTLLFSFLNQQIKSAFIDIVNKVFKRNSTQEAQIADYARDDTCSDL